MTLRTWLLGTAALLLSACVSSIEKPNNPPPTGGTRAIFAPDAADPCASVLPFPSDLAKNPTTGKLDVPFCPSDDATTTALKTGLRTLDGFSINGPIYEEFSGALDPASLTAPMAVMLGNASTFQLVTITPAFNPANNTLYLQLPAGSHLEENTTYVAVITNAVKDTSGKPVISDQVFTLMKSTTPLVDEHGYSTTGALSPDEAAGVEKLRQAYVPIFAGLEANGISRENVAVAWPFTTQTVHASLPPLAQLVTAKPATVTMDTSFLASSSALLAAQGLDAGLGCVYTGRIQLQDLLTATGTFGLTTGGTPVVTETEVPYVLTTPAGIDCGTQWTTSNVAIYVHGLGRCKNDAFALAGTLAQAGYLTLSLDGPYAGSRTVENLGDQNPLDGCPDQPATPELIALPGQTPNPFAIRDALREWGLEQVQVAAAVKANAWQFAGLTAPADVTTTVGLVGHSWGGIAAVLAGSVSGGDTGSVTETATNATPGGLGAAFAPLLVAELGQAAAQEAIATFTWVLEPADPLYAAEAFPQAEGALAQVVAPGGGPIQDAPLHPTSGQQALAAALNQPPQTTFTMATDSTSYCDDSQSMVGELLKPCHAAALSPLDPTDPSVQTTGAMRKQLATFLATDGAMICTPGVDCP